MASSGYSIKDLYPDFESVQSTTDNTVPAEDQQMVYVKTDSDSPNLMTKNNRNHTVLAIVAVVAVLFAFGLIK